MTRFLIALCLPALLLADTLLPKGEELRSQITGNATTTGATPFAVEATNIQSGLAALVVEQRQPSFESGGYICFTLGLPKNLSPISPIGVALRDKTPEGFARAQALMDKYGSRGKPSPRTTPATTSNSTRSP